MKATIRRVERVVFYDLSGNRMRHMEYWKICYNSGTEKTVKGSDPEALSKTQREWYITHKLQSVIKGIYCESAITKTLVYY